MHKPGHLWLLGLSGSGKSTVGPLLARRMGIPFHDTDEIIIQKARRSIPEIFNTEGEAGFRKRETEAIRWIGLQKPSVVACGGGAVTEASNREEMIRTGTRVYLQVSLPLLEKRLTHQKDRPLLSQGPLVPTLTRQLSQREAWYRESEIQLEADQGSPEDLAGKIFERWAERA